VQRTAEEALSSFRVVVVNGPRQAGKTTLAGSYAATVVSLFENASSARCSTPSHRT
jgi:predicted AAA+ superfamily ATPase